MNYYSDPRGIRNIPNYLVAQTYQGLGRLMRRNNIRQGGYVEYFGIQQMQDGRWIAWYVIGTKEAIEQEENLVNGDR